MTLQSSPKAAAQLIAKGLQVRNVPGLDKEYRELMVLYEEDPDFRRLVDDVALGLSLSVLSGTARGLVLMPADENSRFAFRLGDLRSGLQPDEKALIVLIHTAVAAQFYPTGESLENDMYEAPPVTERQTLIALKHVCQHLAAAGGATMQGLPLELEPGWRSVLLKPEARPEQQRRTTNTLEGLVAMVFKQLMDAGLVRCEHDDGSNSRYTANWRMTVQLRESTSRIFNATRKALAAQSREAGQGESR
ncbi:hypothetical protein [Cupriavidus sp. WS]|uniref:hypothetical protein n=1 Tax=Cupriavidus sp. WS TaxID=1312922 RepID=UPI0012DCD768|nr:hypothetical protein [Cupriavidus sp. WS]